ncbi:MAG: LamG-like jellyroll fold domain-containing protein, partial [Intestinibacter sp.]
MNTTSKIYINGQEVEGEGNSTSSPNLVDSQVVIGRLDSTRWANAKIYNIKYYNRALS